MDDVPGSSHYKLSLKQSYTGGAMANYHPLFC